MKFILNRLAWFASLSLGFVVSFIFAILSGSLRNRYSFDSDTFLLWLLGILAFGSAIKKIFLSRVYISQIIGEEKTVLYNKRSEEIEDEQLETTTVVPGEEEETTQDDKLLHIASDRTDEVNEEQTRFGSEDLPAPGAPLPVNAVSYARPVEEQNKTNKETKEKNEPGLIAGFFKENALAKIGGILLFVGVLFLLNLVYTVIGPIGKMMIGFLIGAAVFAAGAFIDKKGYHQEARIVVGVSILINYLVILSGRYLIEESSYMGKTILSEGLTFFFLILNTIFAISASFAYRSNALLFFSFVVSYLNPFLIGAKPVDTPYTLLGYSAAVSVGAILVSHFLYKKNKIHSLQLLSIAFVGGNILFLAAPFLTELEWIFKLAAFTALSVCSIFFLYRHQFKNSMVWFFAGAYVFFSILISLGDHVLADSFNSFGIFASYFVSVFGILFFSVFLFIRSQISSFVYMVFVPLIIFLSLITTRAISMDYAIFLVVFSVISYSLIFSFLKNSLSQTAKFFYYVAFGIFVLLSNLMFGSIYRKLNFEDITNLHFYGVLISTYVFYFSAYYFSSKRGLEQLYSVGTLLGVLMLLPVLRRDGDFRVVSMLAVSGLIFLNLVLPLINRRLLKVKLNSLAFAAVVGAIFSVSQIFYFMFGGNGQSQVTLGLIYAVVAAVYFAISFWVFSLIPKVREQNDDSAISKNAFYLYAGISVSIFSMAMAFIFSNKPEIVSIIWMFEASFLYFFYAKTKESKIFLFASAIFTIGLLKSFLLLQFVVRGNYYDLFIALIIFISLGASLKFLENEKLNLRVFYDIGHMLGILSVVIMISKIVPNELGLGILAFSVFGVLLSILYSSVFSSTIVYFFLLYMFIFLLVHIFSLRDTFRSLEIKHLEPLKAWQYFAAALAASSAFIFNKLGRVFAQKNLLENKVYSALNTFCVIYLFVITSQFVYYLFNENVFVITLYWGLLSFVLLGKGIFNEMIKFRTVGLYILSLTVVKIVLYDIWSGFNNGVTRVIALMAVGGIMIAISLLYTKKYGGQLKGEFNLENLFNENEDKKARIVS